MSENIKFGLPIPQGWRGGDLPLEEENNPIKQYEFSKSIATTADNLNFDSIYAYDHLIPHHKDDIEKNIFECFTLLSSLAVTTQKVNIGQIVVCNSYRNPPLLAKMLSTLDILSKGRVELEIGAGWYGQEYLAYGYDFPSARTRIMQLDESISISGSVGRNYKEDIEYSVVLPCVISESEEEVNDVLIQHKREDKSIKEYSQYLVDGIMVGTPEKILHFTIYAN
jgi:luciferase-like monooxygenase